MWFFLIFGGFVAALTIAAWHDGYFAAAVVMSVTTVPALSLCAILLAATFNAPIAARWAGAGVFLGALWLVWLPWRRHPMVRVMGVYIQQDRGAVRRPR